MRDHALLLRVLTVEGLLMEQACRIVDDVYARSMDDFDDCSKRSFSMKNW